MPVNHNFITCFYIVSKEVGNDHVSDIQFLRRRLFGHFRAGFLRRFEGCAVVPTPPSQPTCAAHLNRDYNAAVNIQRRCKAMLLGGPAGPPLAEEDQELDLLQQRVRGGG